VPVLYSRIGPRYLPPLARFLQQLGLQGYRPWSGWLWGPLEEGPFQPRVRYKRTILTPARWRLPGTLIAAARDRSRWDRAVEDWRNSTVPQPPDIVALEDTDCQLPLDLRRRVDRELLRRYVGRGVNAVLEQPGGQDAVQAVVAGSTGAHILELVVPLKRRMTAMFEPYRSIRAQPRGTGVGCYLPGSEWLSLAIPLPTTVQNEALASLDQLAARMEGSFDRWFWLRYTNTAHGPHLRVRFHGDPSVLGSKVLPEVAAWCSDLVAQRLACGFTVEPYDQEIERYGGPDAIRTAESVFDADSRFVLATLLNTRNTDQRIIVAALSAAAIVRTLAASDPAALDGRHVDRTGRRQIAYLRTFVRTAAANGPLNNVTWLNKVTWRTRQQALTIYRNVLPVDRRVDCASSLIHMHANRLLGSTDAERIARALAADLLARPETAL